MFNRRGNYHMYVVKAPANATLLIRDSNEPSITLDNNAVLPGNVSIINNRTICVEGNGYGNFTGSVFSGVNIMQSGSGSFTSFGYSSTNRRRGPVYVVRVPPNAPIMVQDSAEPSVT